ncbi:hypothetical protein D9M71_723530 [compost metagenome]
MKQEHSGGDVVFGGAKPWGAVAIKPVEHLEFTDHRQVVPGGRIEIQSAFLDQLKHGRGGYRFSRGKHRENTVGGHSLWLAERSLPRSPLVEQTVAPGDCSDYAWDALRSGGGVIEYLIEVGCSTWIHYSCSP